MNLVVNRTFTSSFRPLRGWAALGGAVIFALASGATAASRHRSTWGQILVAGGACDDFGPVEDAELYDPAANRFANTAMKSPRDSATATLIASGRDAGKILISGGYLYVLDMLDKLHALASTELYDPATNSFTRGPAMRAGRLRHTATVLTAGPRAGEVLMAGGEGEGKSKDFVELASTELYDPATRTFTPGPNLRTARDEHTATVIVAGPNAGKVLIAGGTDSNDHPLASTELYNPWSNQIEPGPPMNSARIQDTATIIVSGENSGRILIAGGDSTSDFHPLATTELFDPLANKFVPGPTMQTARESHTATVVNAGPNAGKILIAGGLNHEHGDHDDDLASTELYDPEHNAFAPGPSMNWARRDHTATATASGPNAGRILLSGGTYIDIFIVPNDLYDPMTNSFSPKGYVPNRQGGCFETFAIQLPPRPPHHSRR